MCKKRLSYIYIYIYMYIYKYKNLRQAGHDKIREKMGFCPFFFLKKKIQHFAHFPKLIREMSIFET